MTFIANPPAGDVDDAPGAEAIIVNDGFFPDIDPADIRRDARISESITAPRLRAAILGAILTVAYDLEAFAKAAIAAGHTTLGAIPAPQLDGQSVQLIRYRRAVALYAKAELVERYRDFDTTSAGGNQADELAPSIGELRRDAMHAVREILGKRRTTVELI